LSLQREYAARIDALIDEVSAGEDALAAAREGLGQWRQALLKAAVTGELTADWRAANPPAETGEALLARMLADRRARWARDPRNKTKRYPEPPPPDTTDLPDLPDGWAWATLPQLGEFGRGKSKHRPRNDPRLYGGPYPFVQTGIVANSDGEITGYDQTYSELGLQQSKLWPAGTLCITIAANIAKTGVLNFDACFPDSIVGVAPADGVNARYLDLVVRTLQAGIEAGAPATAQKNINLETLETIPIPLPPSHEQDEIVRLLATAKVEVDLVSGVADDELGNNLRQSILAAAFRGELAA
jgi:type I restriction enzyme S subunit